MRWEPSPGLRLGLGAWCFSLRAQPPGRAGSGAGRLSPEAFRLPSPRARSPVPAHRAGAAGTSQRRAVPACPCHRLAALVAAELEARSRQRARKGRRRPRCPRPQAAAAAPTSQPQLCFLTCSGRLGRSLGRGCVRVSVCVRGSRACARKPGARAAGGDPPAKDGLGWLASRCTWRESRGPRAAALRTASLLLPGPHLHAGGSSNFYRAPPPPRPGSHARAGCS